jgi:hypothetical protein
VRTIKVKKIFEDIIKICTGYIKSGEFKNKEIKNLCTTLNSYYQLYMRPKRVLAGNRLRPLIESKISIQNKGDILSKEDILYFIRKNGIKYKHLNDDNSNYIKKCFDSNYLIKIENDTTQYFSEIKLKYTNPKSEMFSYNVTRNIINKDNCFNELNRLFHPM